MCQVSWPLAVTSEQIAPALLCNVLTTASLWASGLWDVIGILQVDISCTSIYDLTMRRIRQL